VTVASVKLWGRTIGAVAIEYNATYASFQYDPEFAESGIELSPLTMPLSRQVYTFPSLPAVSFHGLPGLLADSLPDKYGNALIDAWLASQGRGAASFDAVERLCYTGQRGMGALEFSPALGPAPGASKRVHIDELVRLASEVLTHRQELEVSFANPERAAAMSEILRVGTSAGGARAKAVIAWNPFTNEVRSGQVQAGSGFQYWLLKFDGVENNRDKELADPRGYGAIEYAYSLMARVAGIDVAEVRLLEESGRRHFMTRRFDRTATGDKLHMQSLAALAHFDFNNPNGYSYEQALLVIRRLSLPMSTIEEMFRRMAFNIVARNQDDHVKNIAFLMDRSGSWALSPGFDMTWSYNPSGQWTSQHQMSMNGKRDGFELEDFVACAKSASMKRGRAATIVEEVTDVVRRWPAFAAEAGVDPSWARQIEASLRLQMGSRRVD
jgi:serine/threonine-protein kinase HipA